MTNWQCQHVTINNTIASDQVVATFKDITHHRYLMRARLVPGEICAGCWSANIVRNQFFVSTLADCRYRIPEGTRTRTLIFNKFTPPTATTHKQKEERKRGKSNIIFLLARVRLFLFFSTNQHRSVELNIEVMVRYSMVMKVAT